MKIAQMRLEQDSGEYRSRTTRLSKWKELAVQAQKDLELPANAPERIQLLSCELILLGDFGGPFGGYFFMFLNIDKYKVDGYGQGQDRIL